MGFEETEGVEVHEEVVLEKFDGEAIPENLFERVYIVDGEIVRVEQVKEVD